MPTLTIQLPNLPPVEHILREEMITIGRMKGNTIALDDASVSISHAKITRINGEFLVKDLNSTNGTMLNGQSINEARLRDGDQIKFGEVIAYYHDESAPAGTTAAPPVSLPPPATPVPQMTPNLSTTFVSKRLVTQASQKRATSTEAGPATTPMASGARGSRRKTQNTSWLVPAIGIAAAVVVAGILFWILFSGGENSKAPNNSNPAAASVPDKKPASKPNGGEQQSVAELTKALKSSAPADRRRAAAELHARGTAAKEAVPQLRDALKDSDPEVRMWSALALINNKSYDKTAIPVLIQTLRHEDPMLRQVACLSLALIPYDDSEKQTVVNALADVANKDSNGEVHNAAISALKIIAPEVVNEK